MPKTSDRQALLKHLGFLLVSGELTLLDLQQKELDFAIQTLFSDDDDDDSLSLLKPILLELFSEMDPATALLLISQSLPVSDEDVVNLLTKPTSHQEYFEFIYDTIASRRFLYPREHVERIPDCLEWFLRFPSLYLLSNAHSCCQ